MKEYFVGAVAVGLAVAAPPVAIAQSALPDIKRQPSAQAVLDEHLDALNHCDWKRIVAQYPDDAQINLPGGTIVAGRKEIGDMFAGFCKDPKDGGLKGINFKVEHSTTIGNVFATQWVGTADFLAEPYRGSDAYITKDGLMQAMVTTFDGSALKMKK
jgi:SnoaL-like domain